MRTHSTFVTALLATTLLAACAGDTVRTAGGDVVRVRPVDARIIPAGVILDGQLHQALGVDAKPGDRFTATVIRPVIADDGTLVIPSGSSISGRVKAVAPPADVNPGTIALELTDLTVRGRLYALGAEIASISPAGPSASAAGQPMLGTVIGQGTTPETANATVISLGRAPASTTLREGSTFLARITRPILP
jgi:predicted small secreted protein